MFDLFGNLVSSPTQVTVTSVPGGFRVASPYKYEFVAALKSLPRSERVYDADSKTWTIDSQHHALLRTWIIKYFGEDIGDTLVQVQMKIEQRVVDLLYLGRTKAIGDEPQALGMSLSNEWKYVFPEKVLREWFEGTLDPVCNTTLYGLLSINRGASPDEIKNAYRRMVRQWHPDVCKESNAAEIFLQIQNAYDVLSNDIKRARYDAGLMLEASMSRSEGFTSTIGYRSPFRCGYVLAEGTEKLSRFVISKILAWEDVYNSEGKVLVTSWPMGAQAPVVEWR
jgi:hypothetical protein